MGGDSDEAPRAGRARPTPDPEVVAKPKRRQCSIAAKFGCTTETLRRWVRQAERDSAARPGIEPRTRNALLIAVQPLAAQVGVAPACQALGVSRASFYRRQRSTPGHRQPRPTPARALCEAEREQILDVLAGPRFVDRAPAEVVASGSGRSWNARFASCARRTRFCAKPAPILPRRSSTAHSSDRRDPFTEPPSGVRRQPLLRGPVQDPEVPPRLPWPLPRHHRIAIQLWGRADLQGSADRPVHVPPSCRQTARSVIAAGSTAHSSDDRGHQRASRYLWGRADLHSGSPRPRTAFMPPDSAIRHRARDLRDELLGLWRPQGLAPVTARRPGRGPLHRRAADARSRPCRGDQGQAGEDHGQRQGSGVPARQGEPAVPGARAQSSVGGGLHPCRDLGRVRCKPPAWAAFSD